MEASDYVTSGDAVPPQPTRCPTCHHPQLVGVPCAVCGINAEVAPLLASPQPTSVEEATRRVGVKLTVSPADSTQVEFRVTGLDELIAAVRTEERAQMVYEWTARLEREHRKATLQEVRAMVEGIAVCVGGYQRNPANVKAEVLAGLAKMEEP